MKSVGMPTLPLNCSTTNLVNVVRPTALSGKIKMRHDSVRVMRGSLIIPVNLFVDDSRGCFRD